MKRCVACESQNVVTVPECIPLCQSCLDRAGQNIEVGNTVVSPYYSWCHGNVTDIKGLGLAVIANDDGEEDLIDTGFLVSVVG